MFIQVSRVKNTITGSWNNQPFGVTYSADRYKAMKDLEAKAAQAKDMAELEAIYDDFKPLTVESYKELAETKCPYIYVNSSTGKFYLKLKDHVSNQPMPTALAERIIKSIEEGIEFLPIVKAWIRFLRNPLFRKNPELVVPKGKLFANYLNKTYVDQTKVSEAISKDGLSEDRARELHTRLQTPITQEGLMVTYKVVRELKEKWVLDPDAPGGKKKVPRWEATIDENNGLVTYKEPDVVEDRVFEPAIQGQAYDPFTCADTDLLLESVPNEQYGHIIKVGKRHALKDWSQVTTTDGPSGAPGLHLGNLDFIRGYQREDTVTLNCFVDPAHIGRITNDGEGAILVKEYFTYGSFQGPNRGIYHSSTYAELGDKEYGNMIQGILDQFGEQRTEINAHEQLALDIADSNVPAVDTSQHVIDPNSPGNQA